MWRGLRFEKQQVSRAPATPAEPVSVLKIERANYVFGLDWRLVPPTRRLTRALALAREEGQSWCALSELEDVVGFLATPKWLRGPHFSACLHLATRYSQGGLELFVFVFAETQYAVIALQESRPVPGFDYLGDAETARAMADEFLAIQRGQPIRLVGNTDFLDGQEVVSPEDLFAEAAKSSRLRSLRSWRALRRGLVFAVLAVTVAVGWSYWMDHRREEMHVHLLSSPAYQQKLYQEGLRSAWATLPAPTDAVLHNWHSLLMGLPVRVQGWRLSQVECQIEQCLAYWSRLHGSYADFLSHLPESASGVDESVTDQDLMAGKMVTRHLMPALSSDAVASSQELPPLREARRILADRFQDLQLLGPSVARVEPAQLFGGQQDPALLIDPVFSGSWSLRHALWLLDSVSLPHFVRVHSLKVDLTATMKTVARASEGPDENSPTEPYFEIAGTYYAQK